MKTRFLAVGCLLLLLISVVEAAKVIDLEVDPTSPRLNKAFKLVAKLSGETCNMYLIFSVDDVNFSSITPGCDREEVESKDWNWDTRSLECGIHTAKAELVNIGDGEVVSSLSMDLVLGNPPNISVSPERPIPKKPLTITITDTDGTAIKNLNVELYNERENKKELIEATNASGQTIFKPSTSGEYKLSITGTKYCGTKRFWVKSNLTIDGPHPENPVVGDQISLAVPMGIGVKYMDSEGNVYPQRTISGGVNFTINTPGTYTLIIGELSMDYWGINKTLVVSDRSTPSVTITPEMPIVNEQVNITVSSGGSKIADAKVTITKPDGMSEARNTFSDGTVSLIPTDLGSYTIKVQKVGYTTIEKTIIIKNRFRVTLPKEIKANEKFTINVRDAQDLLVTGATVGIDELGTAGSSENGGFETVVASPGTYTISVKKTNFWDYTEKINVLGELGISLSPEKIELGSITTVSVKDSAGNAVSADIKITGPEEIIVQGDTYVFTPKNVGTYTVTVTKENFGATTKTLEVVYREVVLDTRADGNNLVVNLSSHGTPLAGMSVRIETGDGVREVITDANGIITFEITESGNVTLIANPGNQNSMYESKTRVEAVVKQYDWLWIVVIMVLVVIAIALLMGHRPSLPRGGRRERSSFREHKRSTLSRA